jgi:hypothetical protein
MVSAPHDRALETSRTGRHFRCYRRAPALRHNPHRRPRVECRSFAVQKLYGGQRGASDTENRHEPELRRRVDGLARW